MLISLSGKFDKLAGIEWRRCGDGKLPELEKSCISALANGDCGQSSSIFALRECRVALASIVQQCKQQRAPESSFLESFIYSSLYMLSFHTNRSRVDVAVRVEKKDCNKRSRGWVCGGVSMNGVQVG